MHAGSAPALDLFPLAALGFGLCLLYRYTGSLYPCFAAHALNNCIAFASLEGWRWHQWLPLIAGSLAGITSVVLLFTRLGLIVERLEDRELGTAAPETATLGDGDAMGGRGRWDPGRCCSPRSRVLGAAPRRRRERPPRPRARTTPTVSPPRRGRHRARGDEAQRGRRATPCSPRWRERS